MQKNPVDKRAQLWYIKSRFLCFFYFRRGLSKCRAHPLKKTENLSRCGRKPKAFVGLRQIAFFNAVQTAANNKKRRRKI